MRELRNNVPPFRTPPPPDSPYCPNMHVKSEKTSRIRFRRGWLGRDVIQVEVFTRWYAWGQEDKPPVKTEFAFRDATAAEVAEIKRGCFWPDMHSGGK